MDNNNKTVLVTGAAGFIGSSISIKLLDNGYKVVGVDNLNHYYDKKLKTSRLTGLIVIFGSILLTVAFYLIGKNFF